MKRTKKPKLPKPPRIVKPWWHKFIINRARQVSSWSRNTAFRDALLMARVGPLGYYQCAGPCGLLWMRDRVQVDHIKPAVDLTGFTTWDEFFAALFCGPENLQVLCDDCHEEKTVAENKERGRLRRQTKEKV